MLSCALVQDGIRCLPENGDVVSFDVIFNGGVRILAFDHGGGWNLDAALFAQLPRGQLEWAKPLRAVKQLAQ